MLTCLYRRQYCTIVVLLLFCLLLRFNFNTSVFDASDLTTFYLPDSEAFEVCKNHFVKAWMVLYMSMHAIKMFKYLAMINPKCLHTYLRSSSQDVGFSNRFLNVIG